MSTVVIEWWFRNGTKVINYQFIQFQISCNQFQIGCLLCLNHSDFICVWLIGNPTYGILNILLLRNWSYCGSFAWYNGRDNILWMIVASNFHLPYIWPKWQLSGSGYIIDHLNLELLLYIHVLGYVNGTLRRALLSWICI